MTKIVDFLKKAHSDYNDYRDTQMDSFLKSVITLCVSVITYSILAPIVLNLILKIGEPKNIITEFCVLFALFMVPFLISLFLRYSKTMTNPENKKIRGKIYDVLVALITFEGCGCFSCLSTYFAAEEGRTRSFAVFMLSSLIIVSLCHLYPAIMFATYLVSAVVTVLFTLSTGAFGQEIVNIYNLVVFVMLIMTLYELKYLSDIGTFIKSKQIEKMNEQREKYILALTHELRTPLNAVLGKNQLIMSRTHEEETLKYSHEMESSGKMLLSLINDMLDYSKLKSGKMNIVETEYAFEEVSQEICDIMRTEAISRNLEFIEKIDKNIPKRFIGDPMRIKQILSNLLSNAIKYTKHGSVSFGINYESIDETCGRISFYVKDTGIGIKQEDLEHLSDEYVRLDEKNNNLIQGTGLGLAITNSILQLMNSKLIIESEYGVGSTFSFTIVQKIALAEKPEVVEDNDEAPMTEDLSDLKILAVDDNTINLLVLEEFLKMYNNNPDTVHSGWECIEMIKNNKYDIVLLDHIMPEMDGVETLRKIKENLEDVYNTTTFIALTANYDSEAEITYKKYGFDGYLPKPIELNKMCMLLEKYRNKKKNIR